MSGWAGRVSFQAAILTVIVGLLVVTCAFLIGYGAYSNRRVVGVLQREYLEQVADASVAEVLHLPKTAAEVLRVQRHHIETDFYAAKSPLQLAHGLSGTLQFFRQIEWVSYAEEATGRFAGANRIGPDRVVLNVSDPRRHGGVPREFHPDTLEPYTRTPPLTEPYEPRTRDWYRRAAEAPADSIVWMPPYTFAEGVKGMTAALAVKDGDGKLRGVLTVDFSLAEIEAFLRGVELPSRGFVLLFGQNGDLLAGGGGPGREAASRVVASWARGTGGPITEDVRLGLVTIAGEEWDVAARSMAPGGGLQWIVAVAVPDEAFMGPVHANRRAATLIALGAAILAVLMGALLSTRIARPLHAVTGDLDRIARFDLVSVAPGRSTLREIAKLQEAVGRVAASLLSFTRFAPEEVVRDVAETGREAVLSGERREVTALFTDLRGFTAFAERLSPEEVVAILNDHFELLVAQIARHGGFVVDFLGDAVFAVFGAPGSDPAHAEHAVACAIDIQLARSARNEETRSRGWPPLEMGVGVDTGLAVVGNMGSQQRIKYGVVGHVVNAAARIETLTVGGQVLVSDETRRALADRLIADGPVEAEGKGVEGAMQIWEVLALRGETMRVLPRSVRDLEALSRPIDAHVRLIVGKKIDPHRHPARIHRLGAAGAEAESEAPLAVFSPLQVLLPAGPGEAEPAPIDGKVIAVSEDDGRRTALVRFTGTDWDTRERVDARARDARARAVAGDGASAPGFRTPS